MTRNILNSIISKFVIVQCCFSSRRSNIKGTNSRWWATQFPKMNVFSGAEMYDVRCEAVTRWQSRPLRPAARTGYTELGTWAQWTGRPGQSWDMECYGHTVGSEWGQERGAVCHTRAKDRLWCILAEKSADRGQHAVIRSVMRVWVSPGVRLIISRHLRCHIRKWGIVRCVQCHAAWAGHIWTGVRRGRHGHNHVWYTLLISANVWRDFVDSCSPGEMM